MKAIIYHRTSLADAGTPIEAGLELCRRHAESKGAEVIEEIIDTQRLPRHQRPGLARLRKLLDADPPAAHLIIVPALHRLFPDPRRLILDWSRWLSNGIHVVAMDDLVDTSRNADQVAWRLALAALRKFESLRTTERIGAGTIASQQRRQGLAPGRDRLAIDLLTLIEMAHQGASFREMAKKLKASVGTVHRHFHQLAEAGRIDLAEREQAKAERGVSKGGRPKKRRRDDEKPVHRAISKG